MLVEFDRGQQFKAWRDDANPRKRRVVASMGAIHYETTKGSGIFNRNYDMALRPANNNQLNGYRITDSGWHYAVQTQDPVAQQAPKGTIGFGGRQGQHWFRFLLDRIGYIHYPTRTVTAVGGAADYSAVPTGSNNSSNFGPDTKTFSSEFEWRNLWTTPGGGECYAKWRIGTGKLKEDIVINQAAREWIAANQPPTTPANETYFGFRFKVDLSDVPKLWNNGNRPKDSDFDDENAPTELRDALDRLLAFMPLDYVYVRTRGGNVRLRKRFYTDGGQTYLFMGAKVSEINTDLLPGDMIFDPTLAEEIAASSTDDCHTYDGAWFNYYPGNLYQYFGEYQGKFMDAGLRFAGFTQIDAGSTIDSATLSVYTKAIDSGGGECTVYLDEASSATWSTGDRPNLSNVTETSASVNWDGPWNINQYDESPELKTILQELIDTNGNTSACRWVGIGEEGDPGVNDWTGWDSSHGSNPAKFDAEWTAPGGAATPKGPFGLPLHGPFGGPT